MFLVFFTCINYWYQLLVNSKRVAITYRCSLNLLYIFLGVGEGCVANEDCQFPRGVCDIDKFSCIEGKLQFIYS